MQGNLIEGSVDLGDSYADLGGGKTSQPATHAMVLMCCALNASWKVPCGYFLIPSQFSAQGMLKVFSHSYVSQMKLYFKIAKRCCYKNLLFINGCSAIV